MIDATGNGIVAAAAGVPYEEGRAGDGFVQPMSIMFTVGGFDPEKRFICGSEEQARSQKCRVGGRTWEDIVQDEIKAGRLPPEVGVIRLYPGREKNLNVVNATQVNGLFGSRSADLTKAEIAARKQAAQVVDVMRRHLPGYANARIAEMPAVVGVRETRRFEGVDRLTTEDVLFCGRCLSASHEALASCRVMGNAMATGVGAGAAAAQAVRQGIDVRAVDARTLGL